MKRSDAIVGLLAVAGSACFALAQPVITDFESGAQGWSVDTWDVIEPSEGNPDGHIHYFNPDTWGMSVINSTNADFVRDFTSAPAWRLSADFKVETINIFGTPVRRSLVLELRDYDNPPANYPYTSVWIEGDLLPDPIEGWRTISFEITDVNSTTMPAGWGGYGAEHPTTFEPQLPANRTWTDMLASVDQVYFTTFVPGWFYAFTTFDVRVDNITIEAIGGGCSTDYNQDGGGDTADIIDLANDIASGTNTFPGSDPDFNQDGGADIADVIDLAGVVAGDPCP